MAQTVNNHFFLDRFRAILFCMLCMALGNLFAQEFQKGTLTSTGKATREIYYDRTQTMPAEQVYKAVYKVVDKKKKQICSIVIVHNKPQNLLLLTIRPENAPSFGNTIHYDKQICGTVFSSNSRLDTLISTTNTYAYLLSFADTVFDYPVIHQIKIDDKYWLHLDPLNDSRVIRHKQMVTALLQKDVTLSKYMPENELKRKVFAQQMKALRDTFIYKAELFNKTIDTISRRVNEDIEAFWGKNILPHNIDGYKGAKTKGKYSGRGVLFSNGNVYDGTFAMGKFSSGYVVCTNAECSYTGNFSRDTFNSMGKLIYSNGNYQTGFFNKGALQDGIMFYQIDSVSFYYGWCTKGKQTGYGEMMNSEGGIYVGEFVDGKLVKGYIMEFDKNEEPVYYKLEFKEKVKLAETDAKPFISLVAARK